MTGIVPSYASVPKEDCSTGSSPSEILSLQRSLFANVSCGDDNVSIAVVAPCNMDAGYTFMVSTNDGNSDDDIIPVTVPPGGIRQGQIFYSTSRSFTNNCSNQSFSSCGTTMKIGSISSNISEWTPLAHQQSSYESSFGQWKDRWFDCCQLGFFHVTLWNACCCPQILAAQILERLQLNWLGDPLYDADIHQRKVPGERSQVTFYRVFLLVILYWCLSILTDPNHLPGPTSLLFFEGILFKGSKELQQGDDAYTLYNVVNVLFGIYTFFLLTKLRYQTRRIHRIPPSNPEDVLLCCCTTGKISDVQNAKTLYDDRTSVDDCCMAVFCGCCSVSQMARQTASYHKCSCNDEGLSNMDHQYEHAVCCSSNGLPRLTV